MTNYEGIDLTTELGDPFDDRLDFVRRIVTFVTFDCSTEKYLRVGATWRAIEGASHSETWKAQIRQLPDLFGDSFMLKYNTEVVHHT